MNGTELDAAIERANRIFSRRYRSGDEAQRSAEAQGVSTPSSHSSKGDVWPPASLDAEQRFAQPHAKLFPFIGRKVRTPSGLGTLIQVFAGRVTVVLDSELSRCTFFPSTEVEPVSWEL